MQGMHSPPITTLLHLYETLLDYAFADDPLPTSLITLNERFTLLVYHSFPLFLFHFVAFFLPFEIFLP